MPLPLALVRDPDHPVERYSTRVQAAQRAYCDEMDGWWRKVCAGEITQARYWEIADGAPLAQCRAVITAASAEYGAAVAAMPRKAPGCLR